MVQRVEILGQVHFYCAGVALLCVFLYPAHRLLSASFRAVAVACIREQRFIDWLQLLGNGLLDDTVYHRWDAQLAHPSIWFRNFLSSHRGGIVFLFPDALKQFRSVFLQPRQGLLYGHPVDTRCSMVAFDLLVGSVQVVSVQNPLQQVLCTVSFFPFPRAGTRHFCILFTFHAIPLHEALSVFCCHGTSPPSGLYSRLTIVRPFPFFFRYYGLC